jgi:hypothetical protein
MLTQMKRLSAGSAEIDEIATRVNAPSGIDLGRTFYSRSLTAADSRAPSALPAAIAVAAFIT